MTNAGDRIRRGQRATAPAEPFRRPTGRVSYPHRVSLDLNAEQYRWVRTQARAAGVSATGLLRAVIDQLNVHGTVSLADAKAAAETAEAETFQD